MCTIRKKVFLIDGKLGIIEKDSNLFFIIVPNNKPKSKNDYIIVTFLINDIHSFFLKENTVNEFVINKRHANHVATTLPSTIDMTKIKSIDIETILSYAK
ncbi:hypothetical protein QTN25_009181 [Entamoeba marina]